MPIGAPAATASPTATPARDRLVGGAGVAVVDHDDAAAGEQAGEGDLAGERGVDLLAGGAEQVDAAMAGAPRVVGRVEALDDLGLGPQRPHADRIRVSGRAERRRRAEHGRHPAQDDDQREPGDPGQDGGERLHGASVPGGRGRRPGRSAGTCGETGSDGGLWTTTWPADADSPSRGGGRLLWPEQSVVD